MLVGIIHNKIGNITSVRNAFEFLKIPVAIIDSPKNLENFSHLILPGVGAFSAGMKNLHAGGWVKALEEEVLERQKPLLGICLGMQLLAATGDEGGETAGLNFIAGRVRRLPDQGLRLPHVGWNTVQPVRDNPLLDGAKDFYFVHSYYFNPVNPEDVIATCDYGLNWPAIINKKNIYGAQFHPEKSRQAGLDILASFVKQ